MRTAEVTFKSNSFFNRKDVLGSFEKHFPEWDIKFDKAMIQQKDDGALKLHSTDGFIINVTGLYCGEESAQQIVDILKYCGFEMDDATKLTIINFKNVKINLFQLVE